MADGEIAGRLLSEERVLEHVRRMLPELTEANEAILIRLADPNDPETPEDATFSVARFRARTLPAGGATEMGSAWAETVVASATNPYPPVDGEACADCDHTFVYGERVFKLTDRADDEWFCSLCAGEVNESRGA